MLFLVLQANYFEKISLILIFSLVNPNAPGLVTDHSFLRRLLRRYMVRCGQYVARCGRLISDTPRKCPYRTTEISLKRNEIK